VVLRAQTISIYGHLLSLSHSCVVPCFPLPLLNRYGYPPAVEYATAVGSAATAGLGGRLGNRYFGPLCTLPYRMCLDCQCTALFADIRPPKFLDPPHLTRSILWNLPLSRLTLLASFVANLYFRMPLCVTRLRLLIILFAVRDGTFDASREPKEAWDGKKRSWVDRSSGAASDPLS